MAWTTWACTSGGRSRALDGRSSPRAALICSIVLPTASSYKNQRAHSSEPSLAVRQRQRAEATRLQKGQNDRGASIFGGIEPAVHVAARLEGRDHLHGNRDLGAIARISSGACVARLDREHTKAAQLNSVSSRQRR